MEKVAKFELVSFEEFSKSCKKENVDLIYSQLKLPKRATQFSAGYDFYAPFDITLKPNESIFIPTGIRAKIREDYLLMIAPRSGFGIKFRLQLDNTVGIIDADYYNSDNEGHIMVKITNNSLENKILEIEKGKAFVQGIFLSYGITVDDSTTEHRNGGFGSTSEKKKQ